MNAYERDGSASLLREISDFASVLATAIPAHDTEVIALAVDTLGGELRDLTERIPDRRDTAVTGGEKERNLARMALKEVVLILRRLGTAAAAGQYDEAAGEYKNYNRFMTAAVPIIVGNSERWSLFNPAIHDAHYAALGRLLQLQKPSSQ